MKINGLTAKTVTAITAGLVAGVIGFAAPATAAPSGTSDAQQTIGQLEAQGFKVIVSRLSNRPLAEATIVSVRPGHTYNQYRLDTRDDVYNTLATRTIYVDVR